MECVTVLKHPVIREIDSKCMVKSGEKCVSKPRQRRTGASRLCSRKKQGLIIAGLLILTLLSYCCLLWLYTHVQALNYQVQNQNKQLEVIRAKIDDLLHVKIIELQNGGLQNDKKDLGGYRNTRTASSDTPHFYLSGSGSRTLGGKFSWTLPAGREFDGVNDHFGAETIPNTRDLEKVTIKIPGMYFIFAKILANGRDNRDSDVNPPMGISLMKRTAQGSVEMMDISWTTQDDRGRRYPMSSQRTGVSRSFPSDTMTVMGIYMLNENDKIYVQRPSDSLYDEGERYFSGSQEAQFGAFLIERRIS